MTPVMCINNRNNRDWITSRQWVNLWNQIRFPFGKFKPYDGLMKNVNKLTGAPLEECFGFIQMFANYSGTHSYRIRGAKVQFISGCSNVTATPSGRGVDGTVDIDGQSTNFSCRFYDIDLTVPFEFRLIIPGEPLDTTKVYSDQYIAALQGVVRPDGFIRVMDATDTNTAHGADWLDRVTPTMLQTTDSDEDGKGRGIAWENVIALANQAKRDIYICVSERITNEYATRLADLFAQFLDPARKVYVEFSNEVWNFPTFSSGRYIHDVLAPAVKTKLISPDAYDNVYEFVARQLYMVGSALKAKLGADRVRPVLAAQLADFHWAQRSLDYLDVKCGGAGNFLFALAAADYVEPHPTWDGKLDTLFWSMIRYRQEFNSAWWKPYKDAAAKYKLKLIAYEGGQSLIGMNPVFAAAQVDNRMAEVYNDLVLSSPADYWASFDDFGNWLPQFGFWSMSERIDKDSVKWKALRLLAGNTDPIPQTPTNPAPGGGPPPVVVVDPPPVVVPPPASDKTLAKVELDVVTGAVTGIFSDKTTQRFR